MLIQSFFLIEKSPILTLMKKLEHLLKNHKHIAFLDFEGTQFTSEMIAIGAVMATLDKNGKIKKMKEPFKIYVKAKNKIGKYVIQLTGITEEKLSTEGVSFTKAMEALKKYIGLNFKKCSFVTFGNNDMRILNQSISYSLDYPKEITSQIQKNYIDYSVFISEFIKDDKGNPMSLVHYCEYFGVPEAGIAHDPSIDAINLANLYNAFLEKKDLVLDGYKKTISKARHLPDPVRNVVQKLANGEDVKADEFSDCLKEYIA